jgi:catechol O-methyltransferase
VISIEANSESAEIARSIHNFAGVANRITIVNEYTENAIPRLKQLFDIDAFDLIFIDHYKDAYLRDVKLLETHGLIKSGTVLVADNVIFPGAPTYLEYIRNNPNYTTTFHETLLEYNHDIRDGVEVSIRA